MNSQEEYKLSSPLFFLSSSTCYQQRSESQRKFLWSCMAAEVRMGKRFGFVGNHLSCLPNGCLRLLEGHSGCDLPVRIQLAFKLSWDFICVFS